MKTVALLGYGTVGSGVYELIQKNNMLLSANDECYIKVTQILVRSISNYSHLKHKSLFTSSIKDLQENKADIVIEVIGGISSTLDYIKYFLSHGVHVVTANKELISDNLIILERLAEENNAILRYDASVGGGIPLIKTIKESLIGNQFYFIRGIINGTTNYILTKMHDENLDFQSALKKAQELGFAEVDPSSDVNGLDSARKLAILSSISYKKNIHWSAVSVEGISNITPSDIKIASLLDSKIKLLAYSSFQYNQVQLNIRPTFIKNTSLFSKIDNEYNGVELSGDAIGNLHLIGKGAGKLPTASAIYGDLIDIVHNKCKKKSLLMDNNYELIKYNESSSNWVIIIETNNISEHLENITTFFSAYHFSVVDGLSSKNNINISVTIKEKDLLNIIVRLKLENYISNVRYYNILQ